MILHSKRPEFLSYSTYAVGKQHHSLSTMTVSEHSNFLAGIGNPSIVHCSAGNFGDDMIDFLDEEAEEFEPRLAAHPWKILIADDDQNVHETTLLALSGIQIHGRPLEFFHAYSAKEAQILLQKHADIALVLLDVVMETVDAGLKLVSLIRNELHLNELKIVLRTGQPGYAPEQQVSHELAIDGYTTKSKLTRSILISVLNQTLNDSSSAADERLN